MHTRHFLALLAFVLLFGAGAAQAYDLYGGARPESDIAPAQTYNRPPADFEDIPGEGGAGGPQNDAAALTLRIDRLERELRRLTGQNEELAHKVQLLEEQLRAARQEPPRAAADAPAHASVTPAPSPMPAPAPGAPRRGDAFDPATQPAAPGAPRPLGSTQPSAPIAATPPRVAPPPAPLRDAGQPMDIAHGRLVGEQPAAAPAEIAPAPAGPKEEYDQAVGAMKSGKYEAAEKSLSAFLARNPKSKYTPAATFNLGESFFLRARHREAAERYLEITTKFAQSPLAPEALLRLGQSLGAMGAREQACASFSEIDAKYPAAADRVKEAAQRERKKIQCN